MYTYLEKFTIHHNPSQNVSPVSLLNNLVMVTNEGLIACKCFKKKCKLTFCLMLHILFLFEIFQISSIFLLPYTNFIHSTVKMFKDTHITPGSSVSIANF